MVPRKLVGRTGFELVTLRTTHARSAEITLLLTEPRARLTHYQSINCYIKYHRTFVNSIFQPRYFFQFVLYGNCVLVQRIGTQVLNLLTLRIGPFLHRISESVFTDPLDWIGSVEWTVCSFSPISKGFGGILCASQNA